MAPLIDINFLKVDILFILVVLVIKGSFSTWFLGGQKFLYIWTEYTLRHFVSSEQEMESVAKLMEQKSKR